MNYRVGIYSTIVWCCSTVGCVLVVATAASADVPSLTLSTKISAPPIPELASTESAPTLPATPLIPDVCSERPTVNSKPWIISSTRLPASENPSPVVIAKPPELPEPVLPPSSYDFRDPALLASAAKKEVQPLSKPASSRTLAASLAPSAKSIPRAISRATNLPPTVRPIAQTESTLSSKDVVAEELTVTAETPSAEPSAPAQAIASVMVPSIAPPNAASLPATPEAAAVVTVEETTTVEPIAPVEFAPPPTPLPTGNIVAMAPPPIVAPAPEPVVPEVTVTESKASDAVHGSSKVARLAKLTSTPLPPVVAEPVVTAPAVTKSEPIGNRPSRLSDQVTVTAAKVPAAVAETKSAVMENIAESKPAEAISEAVDSPAAETVVKTEATTPASSEDKPVTPVVATASSTNQADIDKNVELASALATLRGDSTPTVVNAAAVKSITADESEYIQQIGCSSCGQGEPLPRTGDASIWSSSMMDDAGGCMSCGAGRGPCTPGQIPCAECDVHTPVGRMMAELYHCICCPDPCYEPRWIPLANAALTVDSVRPKTHQTLRWDFMNGLRTPDRAEYYFGRYSAYVGDGPLPPTPPPTSPPFVDTSVEFNELTSYTEAGLSKFAVFVEVPYRSIDPNVSNSAAGFSDVKVGTKSVIFDCELLQIAMQFKTYIPSGVSFQGLGTGHATLEPSVLFAMKLHPDVYFQGQLAEWIPFSADASQAGAILRVNASLNALLWCLNRDVQLIGTLEANTWSFQDGQYINPYLDPANPATYAINASGQTYGWMGPGARLSICNRVDFGMATMFGFGQMSWSDFGLRMEMRTLF